MKNNLLAKIESKKSIIGIVGLGYVGLPLSLRFAEVGFSVLGFDIDPIKVEKLNRGDSYIQHIGVDRVFKCWEEGKLKATTDFSRASEVDVLILCVPTPLGKHQEPDLSFVTNTLNSLISYLRAGQIISLESTTYPGTTEEELRPLIENKGLNIGQDFFLVYSPEREDPGNRKYSTKTIPKIVGGTTENCLEVGTSLYQSIVDQVISVSSTKVAEMVKILENIYRSVNIGLVNELKIVADSMGIDIWEVIDAAATKPFGFMPFYPGPGLGGHCIPIDPFYLTWKAKEYGINTRFIELAGEINTNMPYWVVSKIMNALNDRNKHLKNSKVLILGVAYKKNIDDVRESPSVELIQKLMEKGALVYYSDPYIPTIPLMRKYNLSLNSIDLNIETISQMDCVVIATDHDAFNYEMIYKSSNLIIDTRGRYRSTDSNIVRA
ncbi:MAG: nucleotide sugar dehydrogenase [Pseudanabaena sp. M007S1SP1A06QC]|nr:nucleotide sugar dehydrogenase [Pseudanabaena sp. M007S1SP1A06QC]